MSVDVSTSNDLINSPLYPRILPGASRTTQNRRVEVGRAEAENAAQYSYRSASSTYEHCFLPNLYRSMLDVES